MNIRFILLATFVLVLFDTSQSFAETESFTVSPGEERYLNFPLSEGDRIKFRIAVSGGANDDVVLRIIDNYANEISKGRIYSDYEDEILGTREGGGISLIFDNSISLISSKQVMISYEIILKPQIHSSGVFGYDGVLTLAIIGITVVGFVVVFKIIKGKKQDSRDYHDENAETSVRKEQNDNALSILKERLAKGEITKAEYDDLKKEFT